eukprot:4200184-Ditylum_brightwellii.AAC.1
MRDDGNDEEMIDNKVMVQTSPNKDCIPFILRFLYNSLDWAGKRNITAWRSMVNLGKTMAPKDLWKNMSQDKVTINTPSKKKESKGKKKQWRLTKQASS